MKWQDLQGTSPSPSITRASLRTSSARHKARSVPAMHCDPAGAIAAGGGNHLSQGSNQGTPYPSTSPESPRPTIQDSPIHSAQVCQKSSYLNKPLLGAMGEPQTAGTTRGRQTAQRARSTSGARCTSPCCPETAYNTTTSRAKACSLSHSLPGQQMPEQPPRHRSPGHRSPRLSAPMEQARGPEARDSKGAPLLAPQDPNTTTIPMAATVWTQSLKPRGHRIPSLGPTRPEPHWTSPQAQGGLSSGHTRPSHLRSWVGPRHVL